MKKVTITVGSVDIRRSKLRYNVDEIITHSNYTSNRKVDDVAVLHINGTFPFSSRVQAINLSTSNPEEGIAVISGWGYTRADHSKINYRLNFVNVEILSAEQCAEFYPEYEKQFNLHKLLCAGKNYFEENACHGDSGSPLVVEDRQVGILARAKTPCPSAPGTYTNVAYYHKWINDNCNQCLG